MKKLPGPSRRIGLLVLALVGASAVLSWSARPPADETRLGPAAGIAARAATKSAKPPASAARVQENLPPIIFVQAPALAEGDLRARFPQGSRLMRLASGARTENPVNLTPDFFATADPQVSFDGHRVLFAAREQPEARWQIWEMNADGASKRRVTNCEADCVRPAYLARETIVFTVVQNRAGRVESQVHTAKLDGSEARAITFGPGNYQVETVLKDGRILVSAASPLVAEGASSRALYALRHDGSGLQSLRCEHHQTSHRAEAAELADGTVVFVRSDGAKAGGELAMIRPGAAHNATLNPLAAKSLSPRPLGENQLVVARQAAAPANPRSRFDLYVVDSVTGRTAGLVYRDTQLSSLQAVPVVAQRVPRWYWSTVNPEAKSGYFICLDAYHSADERGGRITTAISEVRVLTLESNTQQERVLGEAPVEADGSFYVAVPPDKPARFELLDAKGAVIRAQRSWIWSRPGEERGCVGCHEDKSVAPENRWPLTLRRFDTPTPLGSEVDVKVEH